ncbi:MAG: heparinase II/III family protein [Prevotella sp.]
MKIRTLFFTALCLGGAMAANADDNEMAKLRQKVDAYADSVARQQDWLLSRLQMYWTTHATDVFVKDEAFHHPGGQRAAVPTVKFDGTRSHVTSYNRPRLEDVVPYDDDAEGNVHYVNPATGKMEKVHPSKTGRQVTSLNRQIMTIARDAARLFAATGDRRYGDMAFGVFDTFVKGIYHRNVPTDIDNSHGQSIIGMTSFEVIHEDVITEIVEMYPLLASYIDRERPLYDAAMKKWADNIIDNGVPHNNWNLFQAIFVVKIANILQSDEKYADHKGKEYYVDHVVNKNTVRQWSIKKLADFGFDPLTGIWYESPGYSVNVVADMAEFANQMDRDYGIDFFKTIPVITKAIEAAAQYLMPNRMVCGFGDTHPNYLNPRAADNIIDYARRHGDKQLEERFQKFRRAIRSDAAESEIGEYCSAVFSAPNVSWLMQRSGMDARHDLAISLNGSLGNHQHANGISMELYGKGFVLGPDGGIGKGLYSGQDYKEYYSQFPAHNTVCVNGVSSYPVMMSSHGFNVEASGYEDGCTFSQVSFTEPETQADQMRTNGIVKTSPKGGYYIDIFRSKLPASSPLPREGTGVAHFHDYFYHNLGQTHELTAADGSTLDLKPTDELAFAGGHLYAYSYIYDKSSAETDANVRSTFTIDGGPEMTMWFKGSGNQTVFKALSPVNMEYERLGSFMPYDVIKQPVLTFVARRQGETWDEPFVAVFEPSTKDEPSEIASVQYFTPAKGATGIEVHLKSGDVDYIFSAPKPCKMKHKGTTVNGVYAVVRNGKKLIEK